ncbi:MAG: ABC transporter permease [Anaerolineae bacterium]|nr:ABC transporter permease [Anaerolineae bacterium]MCB0252612.1 ABC transporter permease [Anaerolineae bacterium]
MRRLWIILSTEFKSWRQDPVSAIGGILPPLIILLAFSIMFGARPTFKIAFIDNDEGKYGEVLRQAIDDTISPFDVPYYDISTVSETEAWEAYQQNHLDGIWVIPEDFSARLEAGEEPEIEMYFSNFIDDSAKNHRIYQAEVMWTFYEKIGMPAPPLDMLEEYPLPKMVGWFPIISVGAVLLSFILGGMMNVLLLTYREQVAKITLEFALSPRSLGWVLLPKIILALFMSLVTGTIFLVIIYLWTGAWPGRYLPYVWLLAGLVSLFWIMAVLVVGLRARHFMGAAIAVVLTGVTAFFVGGGLLMVRNNEVNVPWFSWLIPNIYAVDALRDFILFNTFSPDFVKNAIILTIFAGVAVVAGVGIASNQLRRSR